MTPVCFNGGKGNDHIESDWIRLEEMSGRLEEFGETAMSKDHVIARLTKTDEVWIERKSKELSWRQIQ